MFNNRGVSKRDLSIYSILTIIVLISISGGCLFITPTRGPQEVSKDAKEAALLITYYTHGKKYMGTYAYNATIIKIDGFEVRGTHENNKTNKDKVTTLGSAWAELSPGHHKLEILHKIDCVNMRAWIPDDRGETIYVNHVIDIDTEALMSIRSPQG